MKKNAVVRKIEALLKLSQSTTFDGEAQAALLKAQELMVKYGIEESQFQGDDTVEYALVTCITPMNKGFREPMSVILGKNFRCRPILTHNGEITFFGHKNDAEICKAAFEFAYNFCKSQGDALVAERRKAGMKTAGVFNPYALGFMSGLKEKLDAQCTALMIVIPTDVDEELHRRMNLVKGKNHMRIQPVDQDAFGKGYRDGQNVMSSALSAAAGA